MKEKINYSLPLTYWCSKENIHNDVILSTRVRIVRNIEGYPFVVQLNDNSKRRISEKVLSSFKDTKHYKTSSYWNLDYNCLHFLQEMNFIQNDKNVVDNEIFTNIIYNDKDLSECILINNEDHIKISSLSSGLNIENPLHKAKEIEEMFKENISFAFNNEFGYLSSKLNECGTGTKITLRVFIPCIIITNEYIHITSLLKDRHCFFKKVYPDSRKNELSSCVFDIYLNNSIEGSVEDQIAIMNTIGKLVEEKERKLRVKVADNYPTIVLNQLRQQLGYLKESLLLEYYEGLNIILSIKFGLELSLIGNISDKDLNSLCYITKGEMLRSLLVESDISFEKDVKENYLLVQRLRAIVIQNALTGIIHAN